MDGLENFLLDCGYLMGEQLHNGKYSKLFKSRHSKSHQSTIVKINFSKSSAYKEIDRLNQEFNIGSKFNDSHIVHYLDFKIFQDHGVIFQEDDQSTSLKKLIPKKGFELKKFLEIAISLAKGLEVIHKENIIHNTINPHHIIYNLDNKIVKYIDFGSATQSNPSQSQMKKILDRMENFTHTSPEQTGKIDTEVDYRTDFYSLGITFYELLTGQLPFNNADSAQLIYNHIAKPPAPPNKVKSTIPAAVSDIVLKLLAKNPDDRYQSATGLKADLEQCFFLMKNKKRISFNLESYDSSTKLSMPNKLYGREIETENFQSILKTINQSKTHFLFITGYSGVGKSVFIETMRPALTEKYKYFLKNKSNPSTSNIAYHSISQIFRGLIRNILSEETTKIKFWKEKLLSVLGSNGKIITDMIPELEHLIGKQSLVPNLGSVETTNRFNYLFREFVSVFANKNNPIVLFFDDMQWVDSPSLELIKLIANSDNEHALLLICAYRDNEVDDAHPMYTSINAIKNSNASSHTIALQSLKQEDVYLWIAETLKYDREKLKTFVELIWAKTAGNPFFTKALLNSLHSDHLLIFSDDFSWKWDIKSIQATRVSDNVADFIIDRLHRLPEETLDLLQKSSCLDHHFNLKTLSSFLKKSEIEVLNRLNSALEIGAIIQQDQSFYFSHDRIMEVAYSTIPNEKIASIHLKTAYILLNGDGGEITGEKLFDILHHFNKGRNLIELHSEKIRLIKANLLAAQKSRQSAAYQIAYHYIIIAKDLLDQFENSWINHYQLSFDVYREYIECAYLCDDFLLADEECEKILSYIKTGLEKAGLFLARLTHYIDREKPVNHAFEVGIRALSFLKVRLSTNPNLFQVYKERILFKYYLKNRKISQLTQIPISKNEEKRLALKILFTLNPLCYWTGNKRLMELNHLKQVVISLKFGNSPESACSYIGYGFLLTTHYNKLKEGYEFGKLGMMLNQNYESPELKAKLIHIYAAFIHHWHHHYKTITDYCLEAVNAGLKTGDFLYAGFATFGLHTWDNTDISTILKKREVYLNLFQKFKSQAAIEFIVLIQQLYASLIDREKSSIFSYHSAEDVENHLLKWKQTNHQTFIALYHICKAQEYYFYENYLDAIEQINFSDEVINACLGNCFTVDHCLYSFLVRSAIYHTLSWKNKKMAMKRMKKEYKKMKFWEKCCSINFSHHRWLMKAELFRLKNNISNAKEAYDQAIIMAQHNQYIRYQALANELSAKFYLSQQNSKAASHYMKEASYLYTQWGAKGKVQNLERNYYALLFSADEAKPSTVDMSHENINSIIKASQTISVEIHLDKLLSNILRIMLENSGAQRCILISVNNDQLLIQRESSLFSEKNIIDHNNLPLSQSLNLLPVSIINYVKSTGQSVLINESLINDQFNHDLYLINKNPRSLLCLPIIKKNQVIYIVYLENQLAKKIFTTDTLKMLEILSAQAAISLENALFYEELKQQNYQRERLEKELASVSKLATIGEMISSIAHEINQPLNATVSYINGCLERLEKGEVSEKMIDVLTSASHQAERIGIIIHNLKNFLRRGKMQKKLLCINELIKETLKFVEYKTITFNIEFMLELDGKLENIMVDKIQIQQVFLNLIHNSIEAFQETSNEKCLIIFHTSMPDKKTISITIQDTGPGIDKKIKKELFKPFTTTKQNGMGMGLSISRSIIEAHGGHLLANFNSTTGAEFCITLPLQEAHDDGNRVYH